MVLTGVVLTHVAKWCFLGCVVTCVALIAKEGLTMRYVQDAGKLVSSKEEIFSQSLLRNLLDSEFEQCVLNPSKIFCLTGTDNDHMLRKATEKGRFFAAHHNPQDDHPKDAQRHPVYVALYNFCLLMWELKVEIILLEPSMLYCMLSDIKKIELQMHGFSILNYLGAQNVINVAVNGSSSSILDLPSALQTISLHGFRHSKLQRTLDGSIPSNNENLTVHHFFEKRKILIHVVVFFEKSNYLWCSAMLDLPKHLNNYSLKLFSSVDSAYETFKSKTLHNDTAIPIGMRIPLQPDEFLLQIDSSKFINCHPYTVHNSRVPSIHEGHSTPHLELVFKTALKEFKKRLLMYATKLFIFGDTLFDWYHDCGFMLNNSTNYLQFAIWASDITEDDDEAFVKDRESSENFKLTQTLGWLSEAREFRFDCLGVQVRLKYVYKSKNLFWVGKHKSKGQYFRYEYPKFKLCSADLLGQKIQIPCTPEIVFQEDYGPNWKNISLSGKRPSHSNKGRRTIFLK